MTGVPKSPNFSQRSPCHVVIIEQLHYVIFRGSRSSFPSLTSFSFSILQELESMLLRLNHSKVSWPLTRFTDGRPISPSSGLSSSGELASETFCFLFVFWELSPGEELGFVVSSPFLACRCSIASVTFRDGSHSSGMGDEVALDPSSSIFLCFSNNFCKYFPCSSILNCSFLWICRN